jgi:hypothetical protein
MAFWGAYCCCCIMLGAKPGLKGTLFGFMMRVCCWEKRLLGPSTAAVRGIALEYVGCWGGKSTNWSSSSS